MDINSSRELAELTGFKPFVWYGSDWTDTIGQYFEENGKLYYLCDLTGEVHDVTNKTLNPTVVLVDYFDDTQQPTPSICACDLFTVLMVTGCRCGGK